MKTNSKLLLLFLFLFGFLFLFSSCEWFGDDDTEVEKIKIEKKESFRTENGIVSIVYLAVPVKPFFTVSPPDKILSQGWVGETYQLTVLSENGVVSGYRFFLHDEYNGLYVEVVIEAIF